MIELRFERVAQIIAIAALGSKAEDISQYFIKSNSIRITFSEYVKSQVHLNVVHGLFGRSLREYVETLWFLRGRVIYRESALKVLRYFYSDLSNFLINNGENIQLFIDVDTEHLGLEREEINLQELGEQFISEFETNIVNEDSAWRFAEILDYVKDVNDLREKVNSYTLALVLKEQCRNESLKIVESR